MAAEQPAEAVFYTGVGSWAGPDGLGGLTDAPEGLRRFVPRWETQNLSLQKVAPESLATIATTLGWILRVMQRGERPLPELRQVLREALAGLEGLDAEQAGESEEAAWFFVLLAFHRRTPEEYAELEQLILSGTRNSRFAGKGRAEQMSMTVAQMVEQRGIAIGEERGEQRRARQSLRWCWQSASAGRRPPMWIGSRRRLPTPCRSGPGGR